MIWSCVKCIHANDNQDVNATNLNVGICLNVIGVRKVVKILPRKEMRDGSVRQNPLISLQLIVNADIAFPLFLLQSSICLFSDICEAHHLTRSSHRGWCLHEA